MGIWNHSSISLSQCDPKEIAAAKSLRIVTIQPANCMENEGYQGRLDHSSPCQSSDYPLWLGWTGVGLQYSPYAYFNEHCIFLHSQHLPWRLAGWLLSACWHQVETFQAISLAQMPTRSLLAAHPDSHHYQGGTSYLPMEIVQSWIAALLLEDLKKKRQVCQVGSMSVIGWNLRRRNVDWVGWQDLQAWRTYSDLQKLGRASPYHHN